MATNLQTVFRYMRDTLREVKTVKSVRVLDEGAMVVTLGEYGFDEEIAIYLLAGELSLDFIKTAVNGNTREDIHTMFVLSSDLLPPHQSTSQPDAPLQLLFDLYGGKVYAYSVAESEIRVFPVFIDAARHITYSEPVNIADLGSDYTELNTRYIRGVRKTASFANRHFHREKVTTSASNPLQPFYDLLGVPASATEADVKKAYRRKARQHHPDVDKSPTATETMQAINEAYARIMERFE